MDFEFKPIYFPSENDIDREVFYPLSKNSTSLKCMVGYFSSNVLKELSTSISAYLNLNSTNVLKFIISPNLIASDKEALKVAINTESNILPILFPEFAKTSDDLKNDPINALIYLVADGRIELKIAFHDENLFHTKVWIFETNKGIASVHGSSNASSKGLGWAKNFEQLSVDLSWESDKDRITCEIFNNKFDEFWDGKNKDYSVVKLNNASIKYAKEYKLDHLEKFDINKLKDEMCSVANKNEFLNKNELKIPKWLNYTSGDYSHQGDAIKAWSNNEYKGILSIATGGGKTLTSLIGASLISHTIEHLIVIIAVPTRPLHSQWMEEVKLFDVTPEEDITSTNIYRAIKDIKRAFRNNVKKDAVFVITHELLKSEKFKALKPLLENEDVLLIADEVHNLGAIGFQNNPPDFFKYKLGLSATPIRQFDEDGTAFLSEYFGDTVYEFGLDEAIGKCLVPYNYYCITSYLTAEEYDLWKELSAKISKLSYAINSPSTDISKQQFDRLCLARRKITESSTSKLNKLNELISNKGCETNKSIFFCTDKDPEQLDAVNEILHNHRVIFHELTQDQTSNKTLLADIIKKYNDGIYQALTAKRVLDEGFNVPQTENAYILASNTTTKQWTQRLGRVLRISPNSNKTHANIYDFICLPISIDDYLNDKDFKSMIDGEIKRVLFFTTYCQNASVETGGLNTLKLLSEFKGGDT